MAEILLTLWFVSNLFLIRRCWIADFKIAYYQQKLKNRNIKDTVKGYGLIDIIRSK